MPHHTCGTMRPIMFLARSWDNRLATVPVMEAATSGAELHKIPMKVTVSSKWLAWHEPTATFTKCALSPPCDGNDTASDGRLLSTPWTWFHFAFDSNAQAFFGPIFLEKSYVLDLGKYSIWSVRVTEWVPRDGNTANEGRRLCGMRKLRNLQAWN